MRTSSFRRQIQAVVWGAMVAGSALSLGANRAEAVQAQAISDVNLSPAARRVLQALLAEVPTYGQQLVRNAMVALGPQRAEAVLLPLQAAPPGWLETAGRNLTGLLGLLPPQYHQTFVNGLFQVSAPEVQFANQTIYQVRARMASIQNVSPPVGAAQQSMAAENQAAIDAQILATQNRIYQLQQRAFMDSHMNTMNVADGWIRALGTTPYPVRVEIDP